MVLCHGAPKTAGGICRKSCRGKHDTCIVSPPVFSDGGSFSFGRRNLPRR
nr:MAG TPA: hypothetical protein [Caudoviricetes sp.]